MRQQGCWSLQMNELSMSNPDLHEESWLYWTIIQTPCVQMSPKGENYERQFPLAGRVCCPFSAWTDSEKENTSPSATSKRFFQDLVCQGELRQATVRESLGLIENLWLNIVLHIEHSSLSLSLLFNCRYVYRLSMPWYRDGLHCPHLAPPHSLSIGRESPGSPLPIG
jgi:hypothetical protein